MRTSSFVQARRTTLFLLAILAPLWERPFSTRFLKVRLRMRTTRGLLFRVIYQ
jgi:hypothetical protein